MAYIDCTKCDYCLKSPEGNYCIEKGRPCPQDGKVEDCQAYTRTDLRWRCENFDKAGKTCKKSGKRCTFINNGGECPNFVNGTRYGLDRVTEHYMRFDNID